MDENPSAQSTTQAPAGQAAATSTTPWRWCGTPDHFNSNPWPGHQPPFGMPGSPFNPMPGAPVFPPVFGRPVPPSNGAPVFVPVPVPVPVAPGYPAYPYEQCIREVSSVGHFEMERMAQRMEDEGWSYMGRTEISPFKAHLRFEQNPYVRNVMVGFGSFDVERKQRKMAREGWVLEGQRPEGSFNQVLTFRLIGRGPSFG